MCHSTVSGTSVIFNVLPSLPFCPPGLRPVCSRKLLRWGRFSSFDGGMELLLLFFGVSYLDKRFFNTAFSSDNASTFSMSAAITICNSWYSFGIRQRYTPLLLITNYF